MKERSKGNKGITLIALVITIIVMLILVVVTVNLAIGEGGLLEIGRTAAIKQEVSMMEEVVRLKQAELQAGKEAGGIGARGTTITETLESFGITGTQLSLQDGASIPENIPDGDYYILEPSKLNIDTNRGQDISKTSDIFVVNSDCKVYYIKECRREGEEEEEVITAVVNPHTDEPTYIYNIGKVGEDIYQDNVVAKAYLVREIEGINVYDLVIEGTGAIMDRPMGEEGPTAFEYTG